MRYDCNRQCTVCDKIDLLQIQLQDRESEKSIEGIDVRVKGRLKKVCQPVEEGQCTKIYYRYYTRRVQNSIYFHSSSVQGKQ